MLIIYILEIEIVITIQIRKRPGIFFLILKK